jgi:hypothetical protein
MAGDEACARVVKSGRVSEAKYEPPLLTGYVREGAKNSASTRADG